MTVTHVGSTRQYAAGWESIFSTSGKRKPSAKSTATAKKGARKQASPKKKTAKKKASKSKR